MIKNLLGLPKLLPRNNLWDTVYTTVEVNRKSPIGRAVCGHSHIVAFTRIDHRSGPGWMSDSYEGLVCSACGAIHSETKVY